MATASLLHPPRYLPDNVLDGAFRIPHDNPPKSLLMLTAYLDESGQEQDDWMFIAGFMGDDVAWRKFPELWLKAIGPQREHLHMQSLRFSQRSVRKMLARAALVPKECKLVPIIAVARLKDYADLLTQQEDKLIHAAYMMCCKAAVITAMRSLPENERLEIVFERQDRYGWLAEQEFHRISKLVEIPELLMADGKTSKLANWRFINKEDTILCEPADYLAYALLQRARNPNSAKSQWTYPILDAHLKEGYGAAVLRETARGVIIGQKKEKILNTIAHIKQIIMDEEAKRIQGEKIEFSQINQPLVICKSRVIATSQERTMEPIPVQVRSIDEMQIGHQPCTCGVCCTDHIQHPMTAASPLPEHR